MRLLALSGQSGRTRVLSVIGVTADIDRASTPRFEIRHRLLTALRVTARMLLERLRRLR